MMHNIKINRRLKEAIYFIYLSIVTTNVFNFQARLLSWTKILPL